MDAQAFAAALARELFSNTPARRGLLSFQLAELSDVLKSAIGHISLAADSLNASAVSIREDVRQTLSEVRTTLSDVRDTLRSIAPSPEERKQARRDAFVCAALTGLSSCHQDSMAVSVADETLALLS